MKTQHIRTTSALVAVILASVWGAKLQAAPSTAALPGSSGATPKIQFAAPVYDFGKVAAGATVEHTFVFTNAGNAVLEITDVHPSCGCTIAGAWSRRVEPGKTGSIPIQFHSSPFGTSFYKTIAVSCNDPTHRVNTLEIKGTIWKPIEAIPANAVLSVTTDSSSNVSTTVRLVNHLDRPVTLSDPESDNHAFAADVKTVQPGEEFQLIVKVIPPFAANFMRGAVTLKTSLPDMPTVTVPVFVLRHQARRFPVQTAQFRSALHPPLHSPNQSVSPNKMKQ